MLLQTRQKKKETSDVGTLLPTIREHLHVERMYLMFVAVCHYWIEHAIVHCSSNHTRNKRRK